MFLELLANGLKDGLVWLPFVLGVGLLYKNMKTIDISIDGIATISIISFVVLWRHLQEHVFVGSSFTVSLIIATLATLCCAVVCYTLFYVFIHKLKINAIFSGIIFSLILYAVSVLAIGESLDLSSFDNKEIVVTGYLASIEKILPYVSVLIAIGIAFFFRTKLGLSIRAAGENEKVNGTLSKPRLLLYGFIITGFLVGSGSFCYAIYDNRAKSGVGFNFVTQSLSSFLLVDTIIDYFIALYKKNKTEEDIVQNYYLIAFLQNAVVKAVIGSVLFQTLIVIIIHYTKISVLWKLFLGLALIAVVARIEIKRKDGYVSTRSNSNQVDVKSASFSYMSGHEKKVVFENINVRFDKGINIILGENGIGKTTLLKLINDELTLEEGSIHIFNETRNVFYLRQNAAAGCAAEMTVYENVINILPDIKKGAVISVHKLMDIVANQVSQLGLDFDFLQDKKIWVKQMGQLSGGQIQKMSCLMALLSDCGIILADEPTSGLDDNNTALMQQFFYKLKELGKNVIIVSHDNRIFDWDAKQFKMTKNKIEEII